jgi:hypothetical protein
MTTLPIIGTRVTRRNTVHRTLVWSAVAAALALIAGLAIFGWRYYLLELEERPFSPRHHLLRPSGSIGISLGVLGTVLFAIIFLYAVRKRIVWLASLGNTRHWMDFHIVAGLTAPVIIAFHAAFKFRGIAGAAFFIMLAVALSGVVGRYLYSQIPRSLSAAEFSLAELQAMDEEIHALLLDCGVREADYSFLLSLPSREAMRRMSPLVALWKMFAFDAVMPWRIVQIRRRIGRQSFSRHASGNKHEVERIVAMIATRSRLTKRVVFLEHTRRYFHLWHVIHRPFSYAFAVLALAHIAVVIGLGFL